METLRSLAIVCCLMEGHSRSEIVYESTFYTFTRNIVHISVRYATRVSANHRVSINTWGLLSASIFIIIEDECSPTVLYKSLIIICTMASVRPPTPFKAVPSGHLKFGFPTQCCVPDCGWLRHFVHGECNSKQTFDVTMIVDSFVAKTLFMNNVLTGTQWGKTI